MSGDICESVTVKCRTKEQYPPRCSARHPDFGYRCMHAGGHGPRHHAFIREGEQVGTFGWGEEEEAAS